MLLFWEILGTMFIAEMGDKTQLLMIAMTSKYKLRDIIVGAGLSILALNAIAVGAGSIISAVIPEWLIKIVAAVAFFYFAWSSLRSIRGGEEEEERVSKGRVMSPMWIVFGTFFIAELGDKTQLTAITFAANEGFNRAILVWAACSIGLFLADVIGMLVGYLLKRKTPEGFLNILAFFLFAIFGFTTMAQGVELLAGDGALRWIVAILSAVAFAVICLFTWRYYQKKDVQEAEPQAAEPQAVESQAAEPQAVESQAAESPAAESQAEDDT